MGLLQRLERRSYSIDLANPRDPGIIALFGGGARAKSGISVTPESAMGLMAVYRAVRLLARTMATLPMTIYERMDDGSRKAAPKHPLSYVLTVRPNRWQTPFGFKEMLAGHVELRGNGYSKIMADGRGRVTDLIPLHPDRVTPRSGVLLAEVGEVVWYEYTPLNGAKQIILWDEMFHLRGFSQDGLLGLNPIAVARETLGLALSNQDYAARFFANSATPSGVLTHPKTLKTEAKAALKESWRSQHGGANAGSVAVLEEDMKWQSIGVTNKDSQFIEQRSFDIQEIARMFDLPPHKLMDLDRSTNNNIEHQGIEYVMDAILPRAVNWEETIERDLFLPSDEGHYYVECNLEMLQRGDSAARATFYNAMFNIGGMTPNQIRRKENLDPVDGGDEAFVPLNMVPLSMAVTLLQDQTKLDGGPGTVPTTDPTADPNAKRALLLRSRLARANERLFVDAIGRALKKETLAARRALDKAQKDRSITPFDSWLDEFYPEHEGFVARALSPTMHTAGEAFAAGILASIRAEPETVTGLTELVDNAVKLAARAHVVASSAELRRLLKDTPAEDRAKALTAALDAWDSTRAQKDGVKEADTLARMVGEFIYRAVGLPTPAVDEPGPEPRSAPSLQPIDLHFTFNTPPVSSRKSGTIIRNDDGTASFVCTEE